MCYFGDSAVHTICSAYSADPGGAGNALHYRLCHLLPPDFSSKRAPFAVWNRQSKVLAIIAACLCLAVLLGVNSGKSQAQHVQDLQACQQDKEASVSRIHLQVYINLHLNMHKSISAHRLLLYDAAGPIGGSYL